jgi:anti-sigma factor RsiW
MTNSHRTEHSAEHHEISALMPWYVNDTLDDRDCQRVESHLDACTVCRDDLAAQRRIREAIEAQPSVDYMPMASLKRLQARLDAQQANVPVSAVTAPRRESSNAPVWRAWMAASVAGVAIVAGLFAADHWLQMERSTQANFRTVTNSSPRPQGEVIRAVFAPTVTLVELQSILDEAQLRIVSGPTEAGVYSLASNSTLTVRGSLALLRQHSTVRFAEGTLPEPDSGNSP